MAVSREDWERAEVRRSAIEASLAERPDPSGLLATFDNCGRYLDPPADTVYPLEYAYHLLGDVRGKTVVDYGCGQGENTLVLATRGASVKALDISPELVELARIKLAANQLSDRVEFIVGSAYEIPVPDESVDIVFGMAILHHLDLGQSAREVRRVLRKGGRGIFQEPCRNSRVVRFIRRLIPYQAPDVSPYERPLTDSELEEYGSGFSAYRSKAFLLPTTSVVDVIPALRNRWLHQSFRWDARILRRFPSLRVFSTIRVIEVVK